jgi:hypothetical protein
MFFAKGATDLMQRLARLPTTPHIDLLLRGKEILIGGANASLTDKVLSTLGTRTLEIPKLTAPTFHAEFENYAEGSMPR